MGGGEGQAALVIVGESTLQDAIEKANLKAEKHNDPRERHYATTCLRVDVMGPDVVRFDAPDGR
jgi:hypothetical protein